MCELCGNPDHLPAPEFVAEDIVADDGGVGGIGILAVTPGTVGRPPTALSPETGNDFVDSIINNGRHYVNPTGVTGPVQINYIFSKLPGPGNTTTGVGLPYDWRPFEMAAYQKA